MGDIRLSKFNNPGGGKFTAAKMLQIINGANIPERYRLAATECFNAFDKGAQRPIIFLLMLADLRDGRLDPAALTPSQCGSIYDHLNNTYQSPKVIEIYAQQSFGNTAAMPIDTWVTTFLKWPLNVWPDRNNRNLHLNIFNNSHGLGKVERLLWVTAQARKVHSSACDDALWCLKWGSNDKGYGSRAANPFACNICLDAIRNNCPAYAQIRNMRVSFNNIAEEANFIITTSAGDNTSGGQSFISCDSARFIL